MQIKKLTEDFWWVGTLDPDLRVFDIVMRTEYGTTYNSYLLKGREKTVLFEAAKAPFLDAYMKNLEEVTKIEDIDALVLNHTEPDHTGTVEALLQRNPKLEIYATKGGLNMIQEIVNAEVKGVAVKDGDEFDAGGVTLRFVTAPNLHWPDTMFTYIIEKKILVTCDAFGAHYSYENVVYDEGLDREAHIKTALYYFDNIMGPFKPDVLKALDKIDGLAIDMIATGHGPVLTDNPRFMVENYRAWASTPVLNEKKTVIIPYVSAYGYTKQLAESIRDGILAAGDIDVKLYDMVYADFDEVMREIERADGFLLGTPTIVGEALPPIWNIAAALNARVHGGKFAGVFGSYGWSGEGVPHIMERLAQLKLKIVGDGMRVRFKPNEADCENAFAYGKTFGAAMMADSLSV